MDEAGATAGKTSAPNSSLQCWSLRPPPPPLTPPLSALPQHRQDAIHTLPRLQHVTPAGAEPGDPQPHGQYLPRAAEETVELAGEQAYAVSCAGMSYTASQSRGRIEANRYNREKSNPV